MAPPPSAADIDFAGVRERPGKQSAESDPVAAAPITSAGPPAPTKKQPAKRTTIGFLIKLFFSWRFLTHRLVGLVYLIQYFAAFFLYFYDYKTYAASPLPWSVGLTGLIQAITAALTFTFLNKDKEVDQGYFSDKKTVSYAFVVENSFYAGLNFFQSLYLTPKGYKLFHNVFPVAEVAFVFFPYFFRRLWPKTSFRSNLENPQNKTKKNLEFMDIATIVTKAFYIWAKHFIGLYINYTRYMDRLTPDQIYFHHLTLLTGGFATTPAIFLHTLKFKRYIGPRTAFLIYAAAYMSTFISYFGMLEILYGNPDLLVLAVIGVLINFRSWNAQMVWQAVIAGLCVAARYALWDGPLFAGVPVDVKTLLNMKVGH
ncbi:hypothetical protein BJ742DRAFT_799581 [Cladochytrium replicatum]|nr:hypothetical protein BJ742DRAFT_799581 [Cladochytrium replicatum]